MTAHELEHVLQDDLNFCGCGQPWAGAVFVRDVLRLAPFYDHRNELEALFNNDGLEYVVLCALDGAGLIEHGSGIGGSWLTEKGKEVLAALEQFAPDEESAMQIFPDDTEGGPPEDCKKCYPPEHGGPR